MHKATRLKKTFGAGAISLVALVAVACTSATPTPVATTEPEPSPTFTATVIAPNTPLPIQNSQVTPVSPVGDVPAAPRVQILTPLEIGRALEAVYSDVFETTVESVVKIQVNTRTGGGEGSGWLWDDKGHIVTNFHVVQGWVNIAVIFFDGSEYEGRVVGFDEDADLAVVKIDAGDRDLRPSVLGDSSSLKVGQTAIAMGNPFGNDFTMTTGIVSAIGRLIPSGFSSFSIPSVIQTDAAINPGNSGGPLLDIEGRVIGINTQIRSESGSSSGVGFAVPVDLAKRVVPSLIENGRHEYSFMGIQGLALNRTMREGLDVGVAQNGAYVTDVRTGTPADDAGLMADSGSPTRFAFNGDLIVAVDSQPVDSMDDLIAYLALNTSPGDDILLTVIRGGEEVPVILTLGSRS